MNGTFTTVSLSIIIFYFGNAVYFFAWNALNSVRFLKNKVIYFFGIFGTDKICMGTGDGIDTTGGLQ